MGDHVRSVRRGDVVVAPWHISCGICPSCRRGWQAHCEALPGRPDTVPRSAGTSAASFSDEVRVPFAAGMLVRVPDGIDQAAVAGASDKLTDAHIASPASERILLWSWNWLAAVILIQSG